MNERLPPENKTKPNHMLTPEHAPRLSPARKSRIQNGAGILLAACTLFVSGRALLASAWLALAVLALIAPLSVQAAPVGTAFSYQGRLDQNGQPTLNGLYGLSFALYDLASAGNFLGTNLLVVPVTNGLFTTSLDFGATAFTGDARWLEVGVNTNTVGRSRGTRSSCRARA